MGKSRIGQVRNEMEKTKKKKKVNGLVIVVIVLGVILLLLAGFLLWQMQILGGGQTEDQVPTEPTAVQQETAEQTEPEATESTEAATQPTEMPEEPEAETKPFQENTKEELLRQSGQIETPFLTLHFDETLTDCLGIAHDTGTPYVLEFYAVLEGKPEQRIFDILFAEGKEGNLGVLETDAGEFSVSMKIYKFNPDDTWTEGEINTVLALQDTSNDLIEQMMVYQMKEEYKGPEISQEKPVSNLVDFLAIETPYGVLSYPMKWQDYLVTESKQTDTYRIDFYGQLEDQEPVLLFTIIFGGDTGEQIGAIKDRDGQYVTVNVIMEALNVEGFEDADVAILYEMQEAMNLVIAQLPLE